VRSARRKDLQAVTARSSDPTEVDEAELEPLQRISRKTVVTLVVLAGATWFLLPQFADLPEIFDQVRDADWTWLPAVLAAATITFLGATLSLSGAIVQHVRLRPLFITQVGSAFASKVAPASIGGMALNIRFLERQGVPRTIAVSGVGMNTIAGFVGHMSLIAVFVFWAGRDAFESFRLPDPKWLLVALAIMALLAALGLAIPPTRRAMVDRLLPILRRALHGMAGVLRRPDKLASLIGGSMIVTTSYLMAMYLSMRAFGGDLPFATAGAVFLVGAAVGSAAPTPGGLGAVEAALIAGLVAAGLDRTVAVPAVFLYRLCTFWFPILPGWLCFTWLQRRDYI
jgi:undecaprenyl-diphosphatase